MEVREVIDLLEDMNLSTLKDRLARMLMVQAKPDNHLIPQYEWDTSRFQ